MKRDGTDGPPLLARYRRSTYPTVTRRLRRRAPTPAACVPWNASTPVPSFAVGIVDVTAARAEEGRLVTIDIAKSGRPYAPP